MEPLLPYLLLIAVLLPLASFFTILLGANALGRNAAYIATGAILGAGFLSFASFGIWLYEHFPADDHHAAAHSTDHGEHGHGQEHKAEPKKPAEHAAKAAPAGAHYTALLAEEKHAEGKPAAHEDHGHAEKAGEHSEHKEHGDHHAIKLVPPVTGEYYTLGEFGRLRMVISYYIDSLTVCMFCMVTFIASCIHFYAMGYMHDELHDITDHEVTLSNGKHLHRPGRFPRFFQALSLFCFSMLGLVLAGNIAMVFVFWELVGICSYFLIGFYIERNSASTAANKAFIVNRVGDFGMIIGLMALWSGAGTFAFGDIDVNQNKSIDAAERGLFSLVRPAENHFALTVPEDMVFAGLGAERNAALVKDHRALGETGLDNARAEALSEGRANGAGYWLLIVGGVGIFCGCVGKSAQFPLHVWLPDAMEGPTPVSALVHSATMVAAGVYLVGRFYPVFTPEVLLVISIVGCITLFVAATIAITATDIKRVLAYSTISQLGYMMLALGVGGWVAGLMHLVTHAFFKSLLFMCSGSVIHAVHTNDMRRMGGLLNKMPVTAITMLIGCLAIAGVGVPFVIGFSGYYSKDAILEQALSFWDHNRQTPFSGIFFIMALGGAAITAFYMFRMWFMTFVGKPRDQHAYDHAHESPPVMYLPLVVLSVLAISVAWTTNLLGYGLIAAGFLLAKGIELGWFRGGASHGHGDDHGHGHDSHGHDSHSHDAHAHDSHGHDSHSPVAADHSHDHSAPAGAGVTPLWVATMVVASVLGGAALQWVIPESKLSLGNLLNQGLPPSGFDNAAYTMLAWNWPAEHLSHAPQYVIPATLTATCTWIIGIGLAALMYAYGYLSAEDVRRQFAPVYSLLVNKWWFDELYNFVFVQPTLLIGRVTAAFDRNWIDWTLDLLATSLVWLSRTFDAIADRGVVDGAVNLFAGWTYSLGLGLRGVQSGRLRQYILFIAVGAIAMFVLMSFFWSPLRAG